MGFQIVKTSLDNVEPLRDFFLRERSFQVTYNKCHAAGWADVYFGKFYIANTNAIDLIKFKSTIDLTKGIINSYRNDIRIITGTGGITVGIFERKIQSARSLRV